MASPPRRRLRWQLALSWGGILLFCLTPLLLLTLLHFQEGQSDPILAKRIVLLLGVGWAGAWGLGVAGADRLLGPTLDRLHRTVEQAAEVELPHESSLPRLTSSHLTSSFGQLGVRLAEANQALRAQVEHLATLNRQLEAAREGLVRSERLAALGRLSAGLAHEIGNPLGALMGFVELALATGSREAIEGMGVQAQRIHRTVQELMDFARPGKMEVGPVPLAASVEAALRLVRAHPRWRSMELRNHLTSELPPVFATEHHLVQIVVNLLLNAADACGGRGCVELAAEVASSRLTLWVADDGPGISPEIREQLFEPFVTTKSVGEGTGLGLAICRQLMEGFGGSISEESQGAGKGAAFALRFRPS